MYIKHKLFSPENNVNTGKSVSKPFLVMWPHDFCSVNLKFRALN